MTLYQDVVRDAVTGVDVTTTPKGLCAIRQAGTAAAIWQRQPLQRFQNWIDALTPAHLPRARIMLRPDRVHDAVTRIAEASKLPESAERAMLVDDISALAHIFASAVQAQYLRLRLDVISHNACRKFHVDAVTARLVCTYRGTGTQYGISTGADTPRRIFTVPTGSPILLRGTLWPEMPGTGLRHRSPPIEGTGETRLVLVFDPIFDPEDESGQHFMH